MKKFYTIMILILMLFLSGCNSFDSKITKDDVSKIFPPSVKRLNSFEGKSSGCVLYGSEKNLYTIFIERDEITGIFNDSKRTKRGIVLGKLSYWDYNMFKSEVENLNRQITMLEQAE